MIAVAPYDVVILGGGLAGLTLTRQLLLQHPELRILVIEKRTFPVAEAAHKVGESTVEIGAHYFSEMLGLKKHLIDEQLPKFGLRFFFKEVHQSLAEGTEVGGSEFFSAPSYQVDRGRLENHLAKLVQDMGATVREGARVSKVELQGTDITNEACQHRVTLQCKGVEDTVHCRWLIDASGRASVIKRKLGLEEDLGHDINAIWFRLSTELHIDKFCEDPTWQALTGKVPRRWLSTNHLMGEGYWVWLIPLATGSTSVGIVADPRIHPLSSMNRFDKALAWLWEHQPECAEHIEPHQDKVQDFLAIKKMSRGSRQVYSADRWALTGEAAAFLDPFYSPGSDFIAIGNTMICKLIDEDLAGQSLEHLAPTLQSVFLTLFQNNLMTYRDQYALFGNPRIMALKFVWDYAVYWGFPALLFFRDKLTDPRFIQSLSKGIEEIRDMNLRMQEFFRHWYEADRSVDADSVFVDQSQIEIMTRLNAELREPLDDQALRARFERNVVLIRDLMNEISTRVRRTQPDLPDLTSARDTQPHENRLTDVFDSLKL